MSTVRLHLKYCILNGIGVVLGMLSAPSAFPAQSPQTPLAGSKIPQFTQAIARVTDMQPVILTEAQLTFTMCEFDAKVLPPGTPLVDNPTGSTRVWGYINGTTACPTAIPSAQSYLGPVVVATRNQPAEINYVNNLGFANTTQVLAYKYSTDLTLHWADPLGTNPMDGDPLPAESNACNMAGVPAYLSACAQNYAGPIPAVPHVHGGEVPPVLDGGPDAWWTSDGSVKGHGYYTKAGAAANAAVYRYPNGQQAAPIWFHDHTLGATRLNVYMGLAGAYVITDPNLPLPAGMTSIGLLNGPGNPPTQELLIPLVLQDRMFDTNGQLFFPADSAGGELESPNPDHPYWVPEFGGDTIVVNGKAWPFAEVQAKRYRFLFVNGSNARTYEMFLTNPVTKANGPAMWVISTDGGYLDNPVKVDPNAPKGQPQRLVMMPGERYEVIIDFGGLEC